jgi:mRNA-degrading endonuclease YafQ of YafQ-DinJ toxin-antitoxin module
MSDHEIIISSYLRDLLKKKYSSIKKSVKRKIVAISKAPFSGEPLRHELVGLRSIHVKKNFILVYCICSECRDKEINKKIQCPNCDGIADESVVFFLVHPHDDAYKIADKILKGRFSD